MSFDNHYPNRKDRRKPYRRSQSFDRTCRPGGSCPRCRSGREPVGEGTEIRGTIGEGG